MGITTSGTHSPYLGYPIAMALLQNGDYPPETSHRSGREGPSGGSGHHPHALL
ncbi:MAG: glycine cleavage T C-terminal barrel domain-containing protein [Oscillospiraceae bacterium]